MANPTQQTASQHGATPAMSADAERAMDRALDALVDKVEAAGDVRSAVQQLVNGLAAQIGEATHHATSEAKTQLIAARQGIEGLADDLAEVIAAKAEGRERRDDRRDRRGEGRDRRDDRRDARGEETGTSKPGEGPIMPKAGDKDKDKATK
jgi:hypothetical protein